MRVRKTAIKKWNKNYLFPEHIGLHIRAVGEWTNRLLDFFEKEQQRLHNGDVPAYDEQVANGKSNMVQAYVTSSTCEKVNERSDGIKMRLNMAMASDHDMKSKLPFEKAMSMPNMENKMKKKWDSTLCKMKKNFEDCYLLLMLVLIAFVHF